VSRWTVGHRAGRQSALRVESAATAVEQQAVHHSGLVQSAAATARFGQPQDCSLKRGRAVDHRRTVGGGQFLEQRPPPNEEQTRRCVGAPLMRQQCFERIQAGEPPVSCSPVRSRTRS
jgi:hypothetical protein